MQSAYSYGHYCLLFVNEEDNTICLQICTESQFQSIVKFSSTEHVKTIVQELMVLDAGSIQNLECDDYRITISKSEDNGNVGMLQISDGKNMWIRTPLSVIEFIRMANDFLSGLEI